MFGIFKLLLGGKTPHEIICPICKTKGNMFTKGGVYEGIFEIIGKTEDGGLAIKECPKCKTPLEYDPLNGNVRGNN